jgi:hypothetical protein
MRFVLPVILLSALLGASSCKNTWSQEDKDNYTTTCMEGLNGQVNPDKAKGYCNCMLDKLVERYPNVNDMMEHMQDVVNDPELQKCKENLK